MKPLPKLPVEIEDNREMSSTDDLSSRPRSPSMSSSDESYSKTTEGEGDEDSPRVTASSNHLNRNINPLQWLYPCDIQVDPMSPIVDMTNMKDFEISSTTESQGQQTTTTQNKGDSCNSFEYQDRINGGVVGVGLKSVALATSQSNSKSPFERELQRLLNESARSRSGNITEAIKHNSQQKNNGSASTTSSRNNLDLSYSVSNTKLSYNGESSRNGNNNNGKNSNKFDSALTITEELTRHSSKIPISTSFLITKHPVGLEAIKEITRNKNPSESSHM